MATRTKSASREGGRDGHGRGLEARAMPFVGLLIIPPVLYSFGLLIHFAARDSMVAIGLTAGGLGMSSVLGVLVAYAVGHKRDIKVTSHAATTVFLTLDGIGVTVVVGWNYWWMYTFGIVGYLLAGSWTLYRIDVFRKDSKDDEPKEDTLREDLGLKGTKFRPTQVRADDGELLRTEVGVTHRPGQTVDEVQKAVPHIESLAGAPRGRSRVVASESAGHSRMVIIHKDVLKDLIPWPGPSAPGGCITEPLVTSMGEDQQPGKRYIAGGCDEAPNPASTGWMGMTRTGKTLNAQIGAMEVISRRNAQFIWFDTVKGAQTVRPLRHGLDIIVASDDPQEFKAGMKALIALVKDRTNRLGAAGYRSWTREAASDPRLMMPFVIAHFEEADVLCEIAPEELVFLASKGLSAGVSAEPSLQRASATSMPSDLRFNVGNWYCFGTGDSYSAEFALSGATVDAGAHPEYWKQSKPGYHYFEGIGVDADRYPVVHKSFFATDQEMEAHTAVWAPRMQPLDQGSVAAMGDWYQRAKADTLRMRQVWDADGDALPLVHDGVTSQPDTVVTSANTHRPVPASAPVSPGMPPVRDNDYGPGEGDWVESEQAIRDELDEAGTELAEQGAYEGLDPDVLNIDPGEPVPPVQPGDQHSWRPSKSDAPSRAAAVEALQEALRQLLADPDGVVDDDAEDDEKILRDGTDLLFGPSALQALYPFRSRPWFSETLKGMAQGEIPTPGVVLEPTDSPGDSPPYRLRRETQAASNGHGQ